MKFRFRDSKDWISLEKKLTDIDKIIQDLLKKENSVDLVNKINQYITKAPGKKVRSILLLISSEHFARPTKNCMLVAGIIEIIHLGTLLHDDVIDDAEIRRSQKASHMIWGNHVTILAGDYLFAKAFSHLSDLKDLYLISNLTYCVMQIVQGEVLQMSRPSYESTITDYYKIVDLKTSKLVANSMKLGAYLASAKNEDVQLFENIGSDIGFIFQIIDDVLDYKSNEQTLGKPVGGDLKHNKVTLPLCHLLESANSSDLLITKEILAKHTITELDLKTVVDLFSKYKSIDYSLNKAKSFRDSALEKMSKLGKSKSIDNLVSFVNYLIKREA